MTAILADEMFLFKFLCLMLLLDDVIPIRIATYNIWNVMFNWEVRQLRISQLIKEADPDIIGLQEVRSDAYNIHNQIIELQQLLPQYAWYTYHPVQKVQFVKGTYKTQWSHEGLGILSRHPLISSHVQNLTYHSGPDENRRIVLHASFLVQSQEIQTALVHFSYDRQQQCQNALEVAEFVKDKKWEDVILLGDFNTYNNYEDPVQSLTGQSGRCLKGSYAMDLVDAWSSIRTEDSGFTFSNMPEPGLESRPDRILYPKSFIPLSVNLLGDGKIYQERYGYHITWNRLSNIISTARDSKHGLEGRSCAYDCGPHASCRCGVCVGGGDQNACAVPNCEECTSAFLLFLFCICISSLFLAGLLIYAMLRVMHAMNRRGHLDMPRQLCCLLNPLLYTQPDRRGSKMWCLCKLPPMIMVIFCVLLICLFIQLILHGFKDVLDDIGAVIPEEYFPSDHRLLVVEIIKDNIKEE